MKTTRRSNASSRMSLSESPTPYLPCPHQHFRAPLIDRSQLNPKDHLALLATPRGYRWNGGFPPNYSGPKPFSLLMPTKKKMQDDQKILDETEERYMHQFVSQIFPLMSGEMVTRLKRMLVVEFGMTPKKAGEFIKSQKSPKKTKRKSNECYEIDINMKGLWLKEFERLIRAKITDYLVSHMCARRSKKVETIAEGILNHLCDLTGECCTLDAPRNQVQRLQVFFAEKFAVWLANQLEKGDKKLCEEKDKRPGSKTGEKKRSTVLSKTESKTEPKPKEKKEKKEREREQQEKEQKEKEQKEKEQKEEEQKEEEQKEKDQKEEEQKEKDQKGPEQKEEEQKEELKEKVEQEEEGHETEELKEEGKEKEEHKEEQEQKVEEEEEKVGEEEERLKLEEEEEKQKEEEQKEEEKTEEEQQIIEEEEGGEEQQPVVEEEKVEQEEEQLVVEEEEEEKLEQEEEEEKLEQEEEEEKLEQEEEEQKEEEETGETQEEQEEKEEQEEEEVKPEDLEEQYLTEMEEEEEEEKTGIDESGAGDVGGKEALDVVKDWIEETEPGTTDRESAISKIIEDELKKSMGDAIKPEDEEAISIISKKTSTFIDKIASDAQQVIDGQDHISALRPLKTKVAYSVKKNKEGCYYEVKNIDKKETCELTKIARKKRLAMVPTSICERPKTLKPIKTSADMKKWSKWASEVVNFVEKWSRWIENTSKEVDAHAEDQQTRDNTKYRKLKEKTEIGALEMKRNKKYIKKSSMDWKTKLNSDIPK